MAGKKPKKICKSLCEECKYGVKTSGGPEGKVCCAYILRTGRSRIFRDGHYKDGYKAGYCDVYEAGKKPPVRTDNDELFPII